MVATESRQWEAFFLEGQVEPHIHKMMRLKTGQINDCNY